MEMMETKTDGENKFRLCFFLFYFISITVNPVQHLSNHTCPNYHPVLTNLQTKILPSESRHLSNFRDS